jgi:hypothetical protein
MRTAFQCESVILWGNAPPRDEGKALVLFVFIQFLTIYLCFFRHATSSCASVVQRQRSVGI